MPKLVEPMQDNNRHLEILQALATGTDPITGEAFSADGPYNQPQIIRALFFSVNELEALTEKDNEGLQWSEEEDALLTQRFNEGIKIHSSVNFIPGLTEQSKPG